MQYLARVQNNSTSGINLQLLARHSPPDNTWVVDDVSRSVHLADGQIPATFTLKVGFLVLVKLDDKDVPEAIADVTEQLFIRPQPEATVSGDSQSWLAEEQEKIEHWRHELTLKSQDLTVRNLELESSRETMEQKFKSKQKELDRREEELDRREEELDRREKGEG